MSSGGANAAPSVQDPARHLSGRRLVGAVAWTAGGKWIAQVFSWASTLAVVRLLSPSDFGLMGMATAYLGLVTLLTEFGIGAAIIVLRDLTDEQIAQLNTTAILLGAAGMLASIGLAIPISNFYHAPELTAIIAVMSVIFLITSFRSVPYCLLQRDLRFRTLSWVDASQALVQAAVSVSLAAMGAHYWSLVVSALAGSVIAAVLPIKVRPVAFARPVFNAIRESILFSRRILVSRLSWYMYTNADFVVAGRVLGTTALGAYTVAWNIANLPGEKIVSVVLRVTPTFFSAVQNDKAALRKYLVTLTEAMSVVMFPAVCGFAIICPQFVALAFGSRWTAAIIPMQVLAVYAFLRSIVALLPQIMNVVGEVRFGMWCSLVNLVLLPPSFYIGSRWGVNGIAAVWAVVYPLSTVPQYWRTLRSIDMPFREYLNALKPAFVSTAIMMLVIHSVEAHAAARVFECRRACVHCCSGGHHLSGCAVPVIPIRRSAIHRLYKETARTETCGLMRMPGGIRCTWTA